MHYIYTSLYNFTCRPYLNFLSFGFCDKTSRSVNQKRGDQQHAN